MRMRCERHVGDEEQRRACSESVLFIVSLLLSVSIPNPPSWGFLMRVLSTQPAPVIVTTSMDRTLSFLTTTIVLLSSGCVFLVAVWLFNIELRSPRKLDGGDMGIEVFAGTSSPPRAHVIASPADVTDDPSARVAVSEWAEVAQLIEHLNATDPGLIDEPSGRLAGRGTADGGPKAAVVPPATSHPERWVFVIDGIGSLKEYATLLQQLRIDVGTFDAEGRFAYLDDVTRSRPEIRRPTASRDERFFTVWKNGSLVDFDRQLFANAGVVSRDNQFAHFFSVQLEQWLSSLELQATQAAGKRTRDIRRTWFAIERLDRQFRFRVTRQQWR